jgi:hypothetical protein
MRVTGVWGNLGWLVVLVAVFAVPLGLDAFGQLNYFTSLLMWALPAAYLVRTFQGITAGGQGRRRKALYSVVAMIVTLGVVLDFLLGHAILRFPGCATGVYILPCLPAVRSTIPVEEVLFYILGPLAIVLVYACADELWLSAYNPKDDLLHARLIQVSWPLAITVAAGIVVIAGYWFMRGHAPMYPVFLFFGALLPAMLLYRCVHSFVNWPAFAVTTLYVILTSIVWEVTLAVPREWWGYEARGTFPLTVKAWTHPGKPFPIEAAFVWLCVPFSTVLSYEFAKAFMHHPKPTKRALFGP